MFKYFLSLCNFLLFTCLCSATTIHGKVTDEKNNPLPFVNVFIKGTTLGTTSNMDGIYSLEVNPGDHYLVFRIMGYKQQEEKISVSGVSIIRDMKLSAELYQLKEIMIAANAEDPAYEIIRQAQKKRKQYLH